MAHRNNSRWISCSGRHARRSQILRSLRTYKILLKCVQQRKSTAISLCAYSYVVRTSSQNTCLVLMIVELPSFFRLESARGRPVSSSSSCPPSCKDLVWTAWLRRTSSHAASASALMVASINKKSLCPGYTPSTTTVRVEYRVARCLPTYYRYPYTWYTWYTWYELSKAQAYS